MLVRIPFESCHEPLTEEQIAELRAAEQRPIVYDEDSPKLTDEQLAQFRRVNPRRKTA